jgi:N-carbamoyl-L-amino-acid hydrolase
MEPEICPICNVPVALAMWVHAKSSCWYWNYGDGSMRNLKIDARRLWDEIHETGKIGGTAKGGVRRLTLSDEDRQVRDWFAAKARALGCTVTVDGVGNMFALRAGRNPDRLPIAMGSHLDTQPTGGKFDGILGVLAGVEVLQTLNDNNIETESPLLLINWTNEEGSRFSPAVMGSGAFTGALPLDEVLAKTDRDGISFSQAIDSIGYRGAMPVGNRPMAAYFELHIEQGPYLEAEGQTIGVVTLVQGIRWFNCTVKGQDSHAGTTPMNRRSDAILAFARLTDRIDTIARKHGPLAVATVGVVDVPSASINVVAGDVSFTVDIRDPDDAVLDRMETEIRKAAREIAALNGTEFTLDCFWKAAPVPFDADCIASVRAAAEQSHLTTRDCVSGASHDAAYMQGIVPSAMIFVPSQDGLSHNELEHSTLEHCGAGAQVLLDAVLNYDEKSRR